MTILLAIAGLSTARAESYCVACYEPDAVYRCVVSGRPDSAPPDPRHQVQCIKQIARTDGHARCSVERFSGVGCNGAERVINPIEAAVPLTPPAAAVAAPGIPENAEAAPDTAPGQTPDAPAGPPKTVEELAKTTVDTTKKGLDDLGSSVKTTTEEAGEKIGGVGQSIGDAAKKSWDCVTSLFSDC